MARARLPALSCGFMAPELRLRRTVATRGELYNVLLGRRVVGQIHLSNGSPATRWAWMLAYKYHEGRTPSHGYEESRGAAFQALA
jgi:hypothetical protein